MTEKKEFAPGIPAGRKVQKIPEIRAPREWEFAVQKHVAEKAKEHFDLRLGDPRTGRAHSWALRYLPKPGEIRLATQQPTHTVPYMDFKGRIESGYGKGDVELARRDKAEVLRASDNEIRFNLYPGQSVEEYALRRQKPEGKAWFLHNVTTTRQVGPGRLLPSSKPKYKVVKEENLDTEDPNTELQAKIDGAHVLYQFKQPGQMPRVTSYRPAERATGLIEHTQKLEGFHRRSTPPGLRDTILRGELYAADKDGRALPAARVGGILNAGVLKSRQKQQDEGKLIPVVFDVVRWKGKDVEDKPYSFKKNLLQQATQLAKWLKLPRTATTPDEKRQLVEDIKTGREPSTEEGVIEWHKDQAVPRKAKFLEERDVYVQNVFAEAGEKRKGTMAGGFEFSTTPKGPIIGRVGTGFSHDMKKDMLANPDKYRGLVARVKVQRAPEHYAPRAPSFLSFHLDQELPESVKTAAATATLRRRDDGGIEIEKLSVPEEERGQGKARKLLSHIKDKYKGASLHIRPRPFGDMPMSIGQLKNFYESEGFQTVDGRDNMILKTAQAPIGKYKGEPASPDTVKKIVDFQGITIRIDRPRGFIMKGEDDNGNGWTRRYKYDYGFIPRTKGGDGEGLDVFIGPDKKAAHAYWAVQAKPDGTFDEYKVFLGFPDRDAAVAAYRQHIPKKLMKGMVTMRLEMMKALLGKDSNGLIKAAQFAGFLDEIDKLAALIDPKDIKPEAVKEKAEQLLGMAQSVSRKSIVPRLVTAAQELKEEAQKLKEVI